ncbi:MULTISPECIES: hypothetical protein [Sulfurimonas]|uniref:hypothetical protein n=1 Tax=Sulfurimonas TaxID=202746 RepID=UPI00125EB1EF|nr:hypothetical protein [Sulfurimonas hydrogeniphila]
MTDEKTAIYFKVTPAQKETIDLRAQENGFDDVRAYLKVVALRAQTFSISDAGLSTEEPAVELGFSVNKLQKEILEEKAQESGAKELAQYLIYVALHGVVTSVIEIRSTGKLDSMLERIMASKRR